jgi:hypothetical protein
MSGGASGTAGFNDSHAQIVTDGMAFRTGRPRLLMASLANCIDFVVILPRRARPVLLVKTWYVNIPLPA